ncbi:unnamed protein product [Victoria cruziana]
MGRPCPPDPTASTSSIEAREMVSRQPEPPPAFLLLCSLVRPLPEADLAAVAGERKLRRDRWLVWWTTGRAAISKIIRRREEGSGGSRVERGGYDKTTAIYRTSTFSWPA